ncbi:hypothetical protein D3C84_624870 [compost metagenome]
MLGFQIRAIDRKNQVRWNRTLTGILQEQGKKDSVLQCCLTHRLVCHLDRIGGG